MAINREKTDRIPLTTPKEVTKEIDAYKIAKGYKTRAKAIRALIGLGLESEYKKDNELKNELDKIMKDFEED